MTRLSVIFCALFFVAGCAGDKGSWDEAMKDWRGDNMEMRGFSRTPGLKESSDK